MKAGRVLLITLGVIVAVVLFAGSSIYSGYNQAVTLDEGVKNRWAQVENQLQRRFELIPNVIATVKGVAAQEE
ncbi:MAG: LemA family protein, partial [Nitrospiraceae bacterium]